MSLSICTVLESYAPVVGGMESHSRSLANALAKRGVRQCIVTRRPSRDVPAFEEIDGIEVYRAGPVGGSSRKRWGLLLTALPLLFRLRKRYDVIYVPGFRVLGLTAVVAGALLRKPCVFKAECGGEMSGAFFTGGLGGEGGLLFRIFMAIRDPILLRAKRFVSMYSEMDTEFLDHGVPRERLRTIPNAVDSERYTPAESEAEKAGIRKELGLPADATLVLFASRVVSYKGVPELIEVWRRLAETHPDAHLVICGDGGVDMFNCEAEARASIAEHGLSDAVHMVGAVSSVDAYMRACDVFTLPTQNDAFPLCIIEAMASGLPVVTTPIGGIKDVVQGDQNGVMVEPGDVESLHAAMLSLIGDGERRRRLGGKALQDVRERYTEARVAERYHEVFEEALSVMRG